MARDRKDRVRRALRAGIATCAVGLSAAAMLQLDPAPPRQAPRVEVPASGGNSGLGRFVITARWGKTEGARATAPDRAAGPELRWDGVVRVDCGQIESAQGLGMEVAEIAELGEDDVAAVTPTADGRGAEVHFRSRTREGWDGLRLVVHACPDAGDGGSTLSLQTAQRSFHARLAWSANDFVAIPVGDRGDALEVHTAAALDPSHRDRSRVTARDGAAVAMR